MNLISRKTLISIIALSFVCAPFHSEAQNTDRMQTAYKAFVSANQAGGDKKNSFNALEECYREVSKITVNSQGDNPAYTQALSVMNSIGPFMPNAAGYFDSMGDKRRASDFAGYFVDIALTKGMGTKFIQHQNFDQLAYYAGSYNFSAKRYDRAITYISAFLNYVKPDSKLASYKKDAYMCLAQSFAETNSIENALDTYKKVSAIYPSDFLIVSTAINFCQKCGRTTELQTFLDKAKSISPNDKNILIIQGQLYESIGDYKKALEPFSQLAHSHPNDLTVNKHLAMNQYNLAVIRYNSSLLSSDSQKAKLLENEAKAYFNEAIPILQRIVDYDPSLVNFTQALAIAYKCTGNDAQLNDTNHKLASLGADKISDDYVPSILSEGNIKSSSASTVQKKTVENSIPRYSVFAKEYIEEAIHKWQQKDPFETVNEYQSRVTNQHRDEKIAELKKESEAEYIQRYASTVTHQNMTLKPYDADNGAFLVESDFGQLILPVPRENSEAKLFESNWMEVEFEDPQFCIRNDALALSSITFTTPFGTSYKYDDSAAAEYTDVVLDIQFDEIDAGMLAASQTPAKSNKSISNKTVNVGHSDVDANIPQAKSVNSLKFAVIIANENYLNVAKVPMSLNDGSTFAKYCEQALGIPKDNIRYYQDASYGIMLRAVSDIKTIADAFGGQIEIIFYYAGHGIPNESTKESFLLPIDADGRQTEGCYSLNRLYSEMESTNAQKIVMFLDACFSGSERGGGMLASSRGVALKAKKEDPHGNLVVFSAASDDETALPYPDKSHGLFTYYLLKKLQESNGSTSLEDLSAYISENVKRQAVVINRKPQTPTVNPSPNLSDEWKKWKL